MEGVPAALAAALGARGFTELTDVQAAIRDLPDTGRDLLVSAATGSGKTVAIGLALAPALLGPAPLPPEPRWVGASGLPARPRALILVPTRELAAQVREEFAWLYAAAGIDVALCAGGADPVAELRRLARGATLLIATPGRLRAHLRRRSIDPIGIGTIVLDEADELLARGFRDELDQILATTPEERRVLMFSATLTPGVEALARAYQRSAQRVDIRPRAVTEVAFEGVVVAPGERDRVVGNMLCLADPERALVFRARRDGIAPMVAYLGRRGFQAVGLSGDLGQGERDAALAALRSGRARVCVATDLAARGLDLPGLDLVIHADPPASPESLLHRSGRTGRAGRSGRVALLVGPGDRRRVESLLRRAGIGVDWRGEPDAAEVARRERERLLACVAGAPPGFAEDEIALDALRAEGVDRLARALARDWYSARPSFEPPTWPAREPVAAPAHGAEPMPAAGVAPVWFSLNRGAGGRDEVRRLLPLICRLGGARREQIGRIRVFEGETHFEVLPPAVAGFLAALGRDLGGLALRRLRAG